MEAERRRRFLALLAVEAAAQLDLLEIILPRISSDSPTEAVSEAYRLFHNLKGAAATVSHEDLRLVASAGERVLHEAREGRLLLTPTAVEALMGATVAMRRSLPLDGELPAVPDIATVRGSLLALLHEQP